MKKVLWLASWYPNDTEPFSGDFIKRQAEAVSIYQSLKIIYVGKNLPDAQSGQSDISISKPSSESLKEYILYYRPSKSKNQMISKFLSLCTYFKRHAEFIRELRVTSQLPDLVHVQVAMKAGLIALYLKWKYKIPYVLTEHWTGYYREAGDSLFKKSFLTRYLTRKILQYASEFLPVSEALGNQIHKHWIPVSYQKIPNVVNTRLFFPAEIEAGKRFRFIHISSLIDQKNPAGIVRSFIELINQGFDAELTMVGPLNATLNEMIEKSKVTEYNIRFTGEISYEQVAHELRKSSALLMFSTCENMPCVILEALCTGVPVISTRVGGIAEVIDDDNGILINAGSHPELLDAMKKMILNYHIFNKKIISSQAADEFSYHRIGKRITEVYNSVFEKKDQR